MDCRTCIWITGIWGGKRRAAFARGGIQLIQQRECSGPRSWYGRETRGIAYSSSGAFVCDRQQQWTQREDPTASCSSFRKGQASLQRTGQQQVPQRRPVLLRPRGGAAALQEHSEAADAPEAADPPPLHGLATALRTGVYRKSKRKSTLCLLPCHPPRLFSSALPEFIQNQESIQTALTIWSVQPAAAI